MGSEEEESDESSDDKDDMGIDKESSGNKSGAETSVADDDGNGDDPLVGLVEACRHDPWPQMVSKASPASSGSAATSSSSSSSSTAARRKVQVVAEVVAEPAVDFDPPSPSMMSFFDVPYGRKNICCGVCVLFLFITGCIDGLCVFPIAPLAHISNCSDF